MWRRPFIFLVFVSAALASACGRADIVVTEPTLQSAEAATATNQNPVGTASTETAGDEPTSESGRYVWTLSSAGTDPVTGDELILDDLLTVAVDRAQNEASMTMAFRDMPEHSAGLEGVTSYAYTGGVVLIQDPLGPRVAPDLHPEVDPERWYLESDLSGHLPDIIGLDASVDSLLAAIGVDSIDATEDLVIPVEEHRGVDPAAPGLWSGLENAGFDLTDSIRLSVEPDDLGRISTIELHTSDGFGPLHLTIEIRYGTPDFEVPDPAGATELPKV